jgi:hypothetical protein
MKHGARMNLSPNHRCFAWFGLASWSAGVLFGCSAGSNRPRGSGTTYLDVDAGAETARGSSGASGETGSGDSGTTTAYGGDGWARSEDAGDDAWASPEDAGANDAGRGEIEAGDGSGTGNPPVCATMATWGSPASVGGLPAGQGAVAFTVTPDELTVAWVQPTPGSEGGVQIYAADRASTNESFGPAQALTAAAAYAASDGISLMPDGLGLMVVRADRRALAQATRSSRTGMFGDPDEKPYQQINSTVVASASSMLAPQFTYLGDPVLGQDNLTLMYSGYGGNMGATGAVSVYESHRSSTLDPFPPVTVEHDMGPLGVVFAPAVPPQTGPCGTCGTGTEAGISASSEADAALVESRRHPTGLSADGRTVFYWDSLAPGEGRAAWRPAPLVQFTGSKIVGTDAHAIVTNASCTRLYFIQEGAFRLAEAQ